MGMASFFVCAADDLKFGGSLRFVGAGGARIYGGLDHGDGIIICYCSRRFEIWGFFEVCSGWKCPYIRSVEVIIPFLLLV